LKGGASMWRGEKEETWESPLFVVWGRGRTHCKKNHRQHRCRLGEIRFRKEMGKKGLEGLEGKGNAIGRARSRREKKRVDATAISQKGKKILHFRQRKEKGLKRKARRTREKSRLRVPRKSSGGIGARCGKKICH